jgi:hypothetical protein
MREQARTRNPRWLSFGSGNGQTRRKRRPRRRSSAWPRNPRPVRRGRPVITWRDRVISVLTPHPYTAQILFVGLLLVAVILLFR